MEKMTLFTGGLVYTGGAFLRAELLIEGKKIAGLYMPGEVPGCDYDRVDCTGLRIVPGFVDIHIHGRGGHDITRGGAPEVSKLLPATGVTSFMPATMTESYEGSLRLLGDLASCVENQDLSSTCAEAVGIAAEGMYFSPAKAGAQNPAFLRHPTVREAEALLDAGRGDAPAGASAPGLRARPMAQPQRQLGVHLRRRRGRRSPF